MDTDVARVPPTLSVSVRPVLGRPLRRGSVSRRADLREVCDSERGILVEVLRLDEALEQVPAHGGWRDGRWWMLESGRVGMDICLL
jgi:hypothetical protein